MRFGRILLALLAPLVSLPALKADLAAAGKPPSADLLAELLRAAVPMASVSAAEAGHHGSARIPRIAAAVFIPCIARDTLSLGSPAWEANLRLLTRQNRRAPLRC